jgi:hypothetical protein
MDKHYHCNKKTNPMNKHLILFSSLFLFLVSSCGGETHTTEATTRAESIDSKSEPVEKIEQTPEKKTVYAWVDKLRVRQSPDLKGKELVQVAEGTPLTFTGEISPNEIEITLRGRKMKAPFHKVITPTGQEGWTFAGALSNRPIDVEKYRIAIAFDQRGLDPEEDSGDFGYYLNDAGQMLVGTGIDLIYVDEKFHNVEIKNGKGEIIGVENISSYVKEHTTGIVCIEKGGKTEFVLYDPEMGAEVKRVFGVE